MHNKNITLSKADGFVDEILEQDDLNGDGKISFEEFLVSNFTSFKRDVDDFVQKI